MVITRKVRYVNIPLDPEVADSLAEWAKRNNRNSGREAAQIVTEEINRRNRRLAAKQEG